jgi:hypothetical protein
MAAAAGAAVAGAGAVAVPFPTGLYKVVYVFIQATNLDLPPSVPSGIATTVYLQQGSFLTVKEKNQTGPFILGTTTEGVTGEGEQVPGEINISFSREVLSPELPRIVKVVPPLRSSTRVTKPPVRFTFNDKRRNRNTRNTRNTRNRRNTRHRRNTRSTRNTRNSRTNQRR